MSDYKTTIGLEIHAELKTKSKMFCGCKNEPHAAEVNQHVCPVCMAHPGTLPIVNKEAVEAVLKVGTALGSKLADYSEFDRKNYFYPDIPKAYQISQYEFPFVSGGELAGVEITRVHLEEDTARSQHDKGEGSVVDFNRAGVPLMELVTEPVIHSAKEAGDFARELQLLLQTLMVSDANMEKGEMRVEVNISVSKSDELGTKVEVKNINSFKAAESAIDYEINRQIEVLENGESVVQETRGWDEQKNRTFSQRVKETANDYRYFPDPDIPKFKLSEVEEFNISRLEEMTTKTPSKIRLEYANLGLTSDQIEVLLSNVAYIKFFDNLLDELPKSVEPKFAGNYFLSDVLSLIDDVNKLEAVSVLEFAGLLELVSSKTINSRVAKDLLPEVIFEHKSAALLAESRGLLQKNSDEDLLPVVQKIVDEFQDVVIEYKAGKEASIQFLVGQGMKATKGSANPAKLLELIKQAIGE
ncbi:Asp-tRNA(Asn)/Glu-tRNA(Gln) amidotransferase subunit GatB [Candidatus Kaiserbacteria bacterium]|nr:Asp-tRNA(Asn)/Glu-tRNA(Gln) amidotransferase subunit GatB [Candidatus Kaiserbacteria bacterium]